MKFSYVNFIFKLIIIFRKEVAFISIITAVVFNLAVFCFARFEASRREQSDNVQNNSNPPEQVSFSLKSYL